MSTLTITINLDNEAFDSYPGDEVGRILTRYAQSISVLSDLDKTLKDINGNTVGSATVINFPSEGAA